MTSARNPGLVLAGVLAACAPPPDATRPPRPNPAFTEIAAASGLDFVHQNGRSGALYPPEIMGAGAALLDYDGDGDLDAFLVQGVKLGPQGEASAPADRLFRNDLSETGEIRFVDVSEESGIAESDYGMGVATGDYDNDGHTDLYVTAFGRNRLWRNRGDGSFEDRTREALVDDSRWSVPAVFFDYDRDGLLDLFVGNYLKMSLANHIVCRAPSGEPDYCAPTSYPPESDRLFHNLGGGRFADVTSTALAGAAAEPALGAVAADLDGDGWLDLYVANDGRPNHLWRNLRDGTFREVGFEAGAAVNRDGRSEASMGVDAGDADGDGDLDLFMTHLVGETNTFYENVGQGRFEDQTIRAALGPPSRVMTGFGTAWLDYDGDGDLDLIVVNGGVRAIEALRRSRDPFPFHQPGQLFRNAGDARFADASSEAGEAITRSVVGRGVAVGDVDNDGDPDVLVSVNGGAARLLRNERDPSAHWLGLRLVNAMGRDAIGSVVTIRRSGAPPIVRHVHTDGSYASARDPRVVVGLGGSDAPAVVEVRWLGGTTTISPDLAADRYHELREGERPAP